MPAEGRLALSQSSQREQEDIAGAFHLGCSVNESSGTKRKRKPLQALASSFSQQRATSSSSQPKAQALSQNQPSSQHAEPEYITPADAQFTTELDDPIAAGAKEAMSPCQMTPHFKWQRHGGHAFAAGVEGASGQSERAREGLPGAGSQHSADDVNINRCSALHTSLNGFTTSNSSNNNNYLHDTSSELTAAAAAANTQRVPAPRSPPCHSNPFLDASADEGSISDWSLTFAQTPEMRVSRFAQSFKELRELGRGNFSKVFAVQHKLDGCTYAIKRTLRSVEHGWKRRQAVREVQAHAAVGDHQNIVRYYSAWTESNHLYMQLELCDGALSAEVDAMRPLPEERAMEIVRQIGSALNHMNTIGICHLDVKPANMYLQQSKQLYKLSDLGLAARLDSGRIENEGDAKYMALEVMQSKVCKLEKADVFSLGASVYELIKGSALPGNGPTWHQIRKGKASISGVSKQTQKTIVSMLAHDPAQRPSAEQLARVSHATKGALPLR